MVFIFVSVRTYGTSCSSILGEPASAPSESVEISVSAPEKKVEDNQSAALASELLETAEPVHQAAPPSPTFEDFEAELTSHGEYEHGPDHDFDDAPRATYDPLDSIESEYVHAHLRRRESVLGGSSGGGEIDLDAEIMELESELSTMGMGDEGDEGDEDSDSSDGEAEFDEVAQALTAQASIPFAVLSSQSYEEDTTPATEDVKSISGHASEDPVIRNSAVQDTLAHQEVVQVTPEEPFTPVEVSMASDVPSPVAHENESASTADYAAEDTSAFEVSSDFGDLGVEEFSAFDGTFSLLSIVF